MFLVFNAASILVVLLIAYWWASQGLFSAIIHLPVREAPSRLPPAAATA